MVHDIGPLVNNTAHGTFRFNRFRYTYKVKITSSLRKALPGSERIDTETLYVIKSLNKGL
jgi:hypothetical protein